MWFLVACGLLPGETEGNVDTHGATQDTADSADSADLDQEADDAYTRALTDLPEGDAPCAAPFLARVQYTVDGDTFYASPDGGGANVKVRMIGMDTPEVEHGDEPADCYGNEAWTYTDAELAGNLVWLTFDADCEDDYARSLAYVFRDNSEDGFFNRRLARLGYARQLTIAPDDSFADEIESDVRSAEQANRGLWGACD